MERKKGRCEDILRRPVIWTGGLVAVVDVFGLLGDLIGSFRSRRCRQCRQRRERTTENGEENRWLSTGRSLIPGFVRATSRRSNSGELRGFMFDVGGRFGPGL